MRDPRLERINNRIDHLLDDLTVLKGLERSGADVSAFIQGVSAELHQLETRKRYLPNLDQLPMRPLVQPLAKGSAQGSAQASSEPRGRLWELS